MYDLGFLTAAGLGGVGTFLILLTLGWSLVWKGWALWIAARKGAKWWYIAMLVINTVGILEILYIFWLHKKSWGHNKPEDSEPVVVVEEIKKEPNGQL